MDRYLLPSAIILFIAQAIWFAADLNFIEIPFLRSTGSNLTYQSQVIGKISETQDHVRRKSPSSVVWENANFATPVRAYDSILTLDHSRAVVDLENSVRIHVDENTLITVEPSNKTEEGAIRIRFRQGQIRGAHTQQAYKIATNEWNLNVRAGSEFAIRSITEDNFELEVSEGSIAVQSSKNPSSEIVEVEKDRKVELNPGQISETVKLDKSLKFKIASPHRHYAHEFPQRVPVEWVGEAQSLRVVQPHKTDTSYNLLPMEANLEFNWPQGSYYLSLKNSGFESETLAYHLIPAGKIHYFAPLPRNRVQSGETIQFAWSQIEQAHTYEVVIQAYSYVKRSPADSPAKRYPSETPFLELESLPEGYYQWWVEGRDKLGFVIPAFYKYPIFSIEQPLQAPKLHKPELRKPAAEKTNSNTGAFLEKFFHLLIPKVEAQSETKPGPKLQVKHAVRFSWYPISEADYYIIEISSKPSFYHPEVIKTVKTPQFDWIEFKKEVFYWRVAAGRDNGRMGLFSEAQKIDLSNLQIDSKNLSPGVEYLVEKPPEQKPSPSQKKTVEAPQKTIRQDVISKPSPRKFTSSEFAWGFWWRPLWTYRSVEKSDDFRAALSGPTTLDFQANIRMKASSESVFLFHLRSIQTKMEAERSLLIQESLDLNELYFQMRYQDIYSRWSFGISSWQYSHLERKGLEELKTKSIWLYGLNGQGGWQLDKSLFLEHSLHLMLGEGIHGALNHNRIIWTFESSLADSLQAGFELKVEYLFNDSYSDLNFGAGLLLGVEW